MRPVYLQLTFLLIVLIQSCRPSTNDTTGFSTPGSSTPGDSTQQVSTDASTAARDTITDPNDTTAASNLPMQGEVGSSGDFMIAAAESGLTEVKLAELALDRSTTPRVKEFAQLMLKDHNGANVELRKLAANKSVELPSSLCMECEAKYNALAKKKGADFDSIYMQLMIKDHRASLEKFTFQSTNGGDKDVKQWAAQKVPTLQHHLNMAEMWQQKGSKGR